MQFEVKGDGRLALKLKQEENSACNMHSISITITIRNSELRREGIIKLK